MVYCRNCNTPIDDYAAVCPYCGASQTTKYCWSCSTPIDDYAAVCPYCGVPQATKYCRKCATLIGNYEAVCPYCGAPQASYPARLSKPPVYEGTCFWWGVLGFFFPIAGLVIFIVFKKRRPKRSKSAGIGALIGGILNVTLTVLYYTWPILLILLFYFLALLEGLFTQM